MKDLIQKTITILKLHVKNNLEVINQNQSRIKEILQGPASNDRAVNFEKHYEVNKHLLAENNDFINVQLTLINFLEKYKNSAILQESTVLADMTNIDDEEEVFKLTVDGELPFDKNHPSYEDGSFFIRLLNFYQEREEYEKCHKLMNLKK
ncbi:MAG: hypothetical protein JXB00_10860 [Bacteroidales bacterium]|nr:hypothetical protein [Bacteroidales bacterium]